MLSAEDLGVEEAVLLGGRGLGVRLAADFDALGAGERDVLGLERLVEGVQVQRWWHRPEGGWPNTSTIRAISDKHGQAATSRDK